MLVGGGILVTCMVLRMLVTSASAVRSNLNIKEKFFVGLSWMAKATVQVSIVALLRSSNAFKSGNWPCSKQKSDTSTYIRQIFDD